MSSATNDTVTVTFDPTAINKQSDIIGPASSNKAGVMTAGQAAAIEALVEALGALTPALIADIINLINIVNADGGPKMVSNATRPPANDPQFTAAFADGRVAVVWNTDDLAPNYSDGTNWYDAAGNLT
jgi:hypothetical protein